MKTKQRYYILEIENDDHAYIWTSKVDQKTLKLLSGGGLAGIHDTKAIELLKDHCSIAERDK